MNLQPEAVHKEAQNDIELTEKQKKEFGKVLKNGIYKELHRRELLTDYQLDRLLEQINSPDVCNN